MSTSLGPPKTVRLRYKNPRYDRVVRVNTEAIARSMGFTEDQIFDITLAVEEAYTNAIEHASRRGPDLELEIVYHLHADRIEISVHDTGCGFDAPSSNDVKILLAGIECSRGRGIALIRMLSDVADIISEPGIGTLIRITKYLPGPAPETGQNERVPKRHSAAADKKSASKKRPGKRPAKRAKAASHKLVSQSSV
ncbi:MAG TPA: ATP-binding protein [Candidatus Ozemobacteraceae bacterium]|nr:ATP-binding protein [Candidatus Ozemobacteraceae bacterium]